MASNGKVIVTVAPTGGMASKQANPNLPTQPEEIAESVAKSCKAGAAIAALHARRPDDQATCNADIYRRINGLIRERCDIVMNNSTGGGSSGDMLMPRPDGMFESNFEERLKGLDAGAEMATFDGFTAVDVFGDKEILVITTPSRCEAMAKRFQERGIKPEWEVFNPAHIIQDVTRLIQKGYDKPPYYINMVLGTDRNFQGGMPYSHDLLTAMVEAAAAAIDLLPLGDRPGAASGRPRRCCWAAMCGSGWRTTTTTAAACWRRTRCWWSAPCASPGAGPRVGLAAEAREMLGLQAINSRGGA